MSDPSKPKKQFKSQSVNDLFRQSTETDSSNKLGSQKDAHQLRKSKTQGNTKLKLVSKKSRSSRLGTRKSSTSPSPSPIESVSSETDSTKPTRQSSLEPSRPNKTNQEKNEESVSTNKPLSSRFNWEKHGDTKSWEDIQSMIETDPVAMVSHINPSSASILRSQDSSSHDLYTPQVVGPDSPMSWSSPNSKISSFRKSVNTPAIQSLSHSPLSRSVDSSSPFYNDGAIKSPLFALQSRQNSEIIPRHTVNDQVWKTASSPNIWGSLEERQLSTKSESAITWSRFDIDSLSLDDAFNQHSNPRVPSLDKSFKSTSRFFPSPTVDQTSNFGNPFDTGSINNNSQPSLFRSPFSESQIYPNTPSVLQQMDPLVLHQTQYQFQHQSQHQNDHQYQPQYEEHNAQTIPREFISRTMKSEKELFKSDFQSSTQSRIPISMVQFSSANNPKSNLRRSTDMELPHYPEGFPSTFYKRGSNNFMFIRELQPKIMTSKYSDTVEVKITMPVQESFDQSIKLQTEIVEIDKRDFEGRTSISKSGKHNNGGYGHNGHHGHGHGHHGFGSHHGHRKAFVNSKTYNRNQK